MTQARSLSLTAASLAAVAAATATITAASVATAPGARASTTSARAARSQQLCNDAAASVSGGAYTVQNNEWGSSQAKCITTSGTAGFRVTSSQIDNTTDGAPGGYPSIYAGCHWGSCTTGGLTATPVPVSALTPGMVTSTYVTSVPASGAFDDSYDIWLNQQPREAGAPNGLEVMIWIDHEGGIGPAGHVTDPGVRIGDHIYKVWWNPGANGSPGTVSYVMIDPVTSVRGLDIGSVIADAAHRGYASPSWYLVDVEAGFEIWQGGTGLDVSQFSLTIGDSTHLGGIPGSGPQGPPAWHLSPGRRS
jgi:hypothetical protein